MKLLVTGVSHRSGISKKTGKPYDFYEVSTVRESSYNNESGFIASTFLVSDDLVKNCGDSFPVVCDVSFGFNGRCEGITALDNDIITFFRME